MHYSRMRTIRYSGRLGGGGCLLRGGCLSSGVSAQGGVCLTDVCSGGVCLWDVCLGGVCLGVDIPPVERILDTRL